MEFESLESSLDKLSEYCKNAGYKGWDLFDGLNSRVLRATPLYRIKLLRLAWIQFFKRSPVNLRMLAMVPKGYNAKGLALFAAGLLKSGKMEEAEKLYAQLAKMTCSGYDGICWGYNFDWEARAFFVPRGTPNLVTTVFVVNSFLDYFDLTGREEPLQFARGACKFLLKHLILFEKAETLCFGYIPGEEARVHNANMLGAALLARVYAQTGEEMLLEKSRKAMTYSINALRKDFSWPYGERHHHQFVDNFHTGFNLVALHDWMTYTGDCCWEQQLTGAYKYFLDTFWLEDGCPKYYNNRLYPIDIHCSAQGILTCLKLAGLDDRSLSMAHKIADWAMKNMMSSNGYFYYQKTKWYTNKNAYIRWSQAWMFYALASLLINGKLVEQ
ncbi:MAG: hypothetical protein ACKVE4_09240 [Dissulfuribacterales bacterium]